MVDEEFTDLDELEKFETDESDAPAEKEAEPEPKALPPSHRGAKARHFVNHHAPTASLVAIVVMVFSFVYIYQHLSSRTIRIVDSYYYDLNTKKLFIANNDQYPPIMAPSGENVGVRAHVFSCSDCRDESSRFIGWLEMYTQAAIETMNNPDDIDDIDYMSMDEGILIRGPEDEEWVAASSEDGYAIYEKVEARCGEGESAQLGPEPCYP